MCMEDDLFCYAGKNAKMNLREKDYRREYLLFLNILWDYIDYWEKWSGSSGWGPYEDPDSIMVSGNRINPKFYLDLSDFLNAKADDETGKKYKFEDNFITCGDGVNLVSDQFGFSAPGLGLNHPYDIYLKKCKAEGKDKDEAINKVVNWVMESRTIGGSFLWPEGIWKPKDGKFGYNTDRGGGNPFDEKGEYKGNRYSKYYIEDRVDLTLCEIKHYLDTENYENDILYKYIKEDPVEKEKEWIKSFGSFKGYVDYFCFCPFVSRKEGYMPYDIVNSDIVNGVKICIDEGKIKQKRNADNSIYGLNSDELEKMFNNVNALIKERSRIIQNKLWVKG